MSKRLKKIAKTAIAAAALALSVGSAKAEVFFFYSGADLVAKMTTSGSTDFRLDFLYAPATSGVAFINDILLGYTGAIGSAAFSNLSGDTAGDATACQIGPGCAGEGTVADWKISWPTSNTSARFQEGEFSMFRISPSDITAWDFSRLHINAYLNGESIKLTGCQEGNCQPPGKLPEPSTLALVGLALLGGASLRRRRLPA